MRDLGVRHVARRDTRAAVVLIARLVYPIVCDDEAAVLQRRRLDWVADVADRDGTTCTPFESSQDNTFTNKSLLASEYMGNTSQIVPFYKHDLDI